MRLENIHGEPLKASLHGSFAICVGEPTGDMDRINFVGAALLW
jgi:hypothetical protein